MWGKTDPLPSIIYLSKLDSMKESGRVDGREHSQKDIWQ